MKNINIIIVIYFIIVILIFPSAALAVNATLSFDPSSGTLNKGCTYPINIIVDTGGIPSDGTDAIIFYDAAKFSITSSDITSNSATYADFPGSTVDESVGKIYIAGLASLTTPFTGRGTMATMKFKVKDDASTGATQIKFEFDPQVKNRTTDSNIIERETTADVLNSVVNGSYIIGTGACATATTPTSTPAGGRGGTGGTLATPSGTLKSSITPTPTSSAPSRLPDGGTAELTSAIAIVGAVLTVLGVLGLVLL